MLRADGSVDLVNHPLILNNMKYYASDLAEGLCKVARFSASFAEQTAYDGQHCISLDIRGLFKKQEAWLEMKWTRSDLRSALALTKPRVTEFHSIAVERKALVLHSCLGGKPLPQPHFIGGCAVSPDGWLLELMDLTSGTKERWKGLFVSSPPHPAPSKAIARRGPYVKRTTTPAQSRQACLQKYVRYNQSAKGQLRSQRRGTKQARADYWREYALTDNGRAKRAQARAAYKARQKLFKRPSQNSKTAIPQYRMGSFNPPNIIWVPSCLIRKGSLSTYSPCPNMVVVIPPKNKNEIKLNYIHAYLHIYIYT